MAVHEVEPPPARVVVNEAMKRVSAATLTYLHNPSDEAAEEYARAFVQLRVALEVLARQPTNEKELHHAA